MKILSASAERICSTCKVVNCKKVHEKINPGSGVTVVFMLMRERSIAVVNSCLFLNIGLILNI